MLSQSQIIADLKSQVASLSSTLDDCVKILGDRMYLIDDGKRSDSALRQRVPAILKLVIKHRSNQ